MLRGTRESTTPEVSLGYWAVLYDIAVLGTDEGEMFPNRSRTPTLHSRFIYLVYSSTYPLFHLVPRVRRPNWRGLSQLETYLILVRLQRASHHTLVTYDTLMS